MLLIKDSFLYQSLRGSLRVMLPEERTRSLIVLVYLFINSLFEVVGLAALIPLINILVDVEGSDGFVSSTSQSLGLDDERVLIVSLVVTIFTLFTLKNCVSLFIFKKQADFAYGLFVRLSLQMQCYYYAKGYLFLKGKNSNEVYRDINYIPQRFAENVVLPLCQFINEMIVIGLIMAGLFYFESKAVVLLGVFVLPFVAIFYLYVKSRITRLEGVVNACIPKLGNSIYQSIFGFDDILLSGCSEYYRAIIESNLIALTDSAAKRAVYKLAPTKVIETGMIFGLVIIVSVGVYISEDRSETAAVLGLFALAGYRLMPSINRIMIAVLSIKSHQFAFEGVARVSESQICEVEFDLSEQKELEALPFNNHISFRDITFSYPSSDRAVLRGLNLTIQKGELVGVVGESGSGKSTFINLLMGFIEPDSGTILVDERKLDRSSVSAWRRRVYSVQQSVYLFDATIAENVALGEPLEEIDEGRVRSALRDACLLEHVESLPEGIYSSTGERGSRFSGGQSQRLGIARALYSNADVLLFDEATSALDDETERQISDSITALRAAGVTIILIAHRKTTLKDCDRILEIERGQVLSESTYEEIITRV